MVLPRELTCDGTIISLIYFNDTGGHYSGPYDETCLSKFVIRKADGNRTFPFRATEYQKSVPGCIPVVHGLASVQSNSRICELNTRDAPSQMSARKITNVTIGAVFGGDLNFSRSTLRDVTIGSIFLREGILDLQGSTLVGVNFSRILGFREYEWDFDIEGTHIGPSRVSFDESEVRDSSFGVIFPREPISSRGARITRSRIEGLHGADLRNGVIEDSIVKFLLLATGEDIYS